jgi:hypothetical protein
VLNDVVVGAAMRGACDGDVIRVGDLFSFAVPLAEA